LTPNKDGKYVFKSINFDSLFLPSPADICQLLGFPDNVVKMIPVLEAHHDQPLNVSRSSRADITKNGVAKPTMNKLSHWMRLLPIPIKRLIHMPTMLKTYRAMRVGSNSGLWYSASNGLRLSNHDSDLVTLFDFIDVRAEADYQMVKSIKHQIREKIIDRNDSNAVWQAQLATWQKHSLVPAERLACYSFYAASPDDPVFKTEQEGTAVLKAVFHLIFDFYFSAIAHFELGLSLYYMRCGVKDVSEPHRSLFSSAIHTYAVADERCSCFGAMLNELRTVLEKHDLDSSWRALAAYIDIEESGECAETINDKQYRQLKDWRNRENMPSANKQRQFVGNLMNDLVGDDVDTAFDIDTVLIYLRIANGIDTLVEKFLKQVNDEKVLLIIAEVLADYPRYFDHYKQAL
jgi:hypothetical protein